MTNKLRKLALPIHAIVSWIILIFVFKELGTGGLLAFFAGVIMIITFNELEEG